MNGELFEVLSAACRMVHHRFGETRPELLSVSVRYSYAADPTKPITDLTSAWDALRKRANVRCRLHDLRHTAATKMAEAGVPESTMLVAYGPHEPSDAGALLAHPDGCKARCCGSTHDRARVCEFRCSPHKIPHSSRTVRLFTDA